MAYKHGAYGEITQSKATAAALTDTVLVYVGLAPVNLIAGYSAAGVINTPVKLRNMNEVQAVVGYSHNWNTFTLCEAFTEHFNNTIANSGPIYIINVLDPDIHRGTQISLSDQDFSAGYVYIKSDAAILDTVRVSGKVLGTDYSVSYDMTNGTVVIKALTSLSTTETVTYYPIDASTITEETIIGAVNADGSVSGMKAIKLLYTMFNAVPSLLACPGWSEKPEVYQAMCSTVQKINGHWDAFVVADIPIEEPRSEKNIAVTSHVASFANPDMILSTVKVFEHGQTSPSTLGTDYTLNYTGGTLTVTLVSGSDIYSATALDIEYAEAIDTIAKAIAWQSNNGYNSERSKVCWPQIMDGNGKKYHLSTVCAATMLQVDLGHESIPMESPSNKTIMATSQYFGSGSKNLGYDQDETNALNERGVTSACFWNGNWVLWGPHTAAFQYSSTMDARYIFDVNMRMLMFVTNGFQQRHGTEIDAPMTVAMKDTVVHAEQEELDRLVGLGAILGRPTVDFLETENSKTNMLNGDFVWDISFTNTPPFKSGTVRVCYTSDGFAAYFGGDE
jgi:phage tail sheath protein FI